MAVTSKSPRAVALAALNTAQRALPAYSHVCSPKTFTQHQLFACLALKNFLKTDYRGVVAHLTDHPALVEALGLKKVPHYTTLQKASRRLLAADKARRLLDVTVRQQMGRRQRVRSAAIDSTGLQCGTASAYFVASTQKGGKSLENSRLSSISQAGRGLRYQQPFYSRFSGGPWPATRCG